MTKVNGETTLLTSGVLQDKRIKSIWLDGRTKAEELLQQNNRDA